MRRHLRLASTFASQAIATGAMVFLLAACGDKSSAEGSGSASTESGTGGESGDESGSEEGSGEGGETACGAETCAADEFCDWPQNGCGKSGTETGACVPRPGPCPEIPSPRVCGCDGEIHQSQCEAANAGTDVSVDGGCPLIDDSFECGYTWCPMEFEYCRQSVSDTDDPDIWSCIPIPDSCGGILDCDGCLAAEPCADFSCDEMGVPHIICPGG